MNKTTLLKGIAIFASTVLVTAACSRHGKNTTSSAQPDALAQTFKEIQPDFNSKDTTLSSKIEGIDLDSQTTTVKGGKSAFRTISISTLISGLPDAVVLAESSSDVETGNGPIVEQNGWTDLAASQAIDATTALGGTVSAKARCKDAMCVRIAVWIKVVPSAADVKAYGAKTSSVGYIFKGNALETTMGKTTSVEKAMESRKTRSTEPKSENF